MALEKMERLKVSGWAMMIARNVGRKNPMTDPIKTIEEALTKSRDWFRGKVLENSFSDCVVKNDRCKYFTKRRDACNDALQALKDMQKPQPFCQCRQNGQRVDVDLAKLKSNALKNTNLRQIPEFIVADTVNYLASKGHLNREGFVSVPIEPTHEMEIAALKLTKDVYGGAPWPKDIYKAMIKAAQNEEN